MPFSNSPPTGFFAGFRGDSFLPVYLAHNTHGIGYNTQKDTRLTTFFYGAKEVEFIAIGIRKRIVKLAVGERKKGFSV